MAKTLEERFFAKVNKNGPGGCWLWTGANIRGYGNFVWPEGKETLAHRVSYRLVHGTIAPGLHLDHLCKVLACVNPAHLEAVTPQENNRRQTHYEREKMHCDNGHEFSAENTRIKVRKSGVTQRVCRRCDVEVRRRKNRNVLDLRARVAELETQVAALEAERDEWRKTAEERADEIIPAGRRIATLEAELADASKEIEAYITTVGTLESELAEAQEDINDLMESERKRQEVIDHLRAQLAEAQKAGAENARLREAFERQWRVGRHERATGDTGIHDIDWLMHRLRAALATDSSEKEGK